MAIRLLLAAVLLAWGSHLRADDAAAKLLADARTHLAKGRYEEAAETLARVEKAKAPQPETVLLASRAAQAVGQWERAETVIDDALKSAADNASLLARKAELHWLRGRWTDAERVAAEAIAVEDDHLLARLVLADTLTETGRLDEANEAYRWFIRHYNKRQPEDAESLLLIARGSIQFARWNHNTQIFHFVVNTLCGDALKSDANSFEAKLLAGSLLLEKYNREQAIPKLRDVLAMNPRATEALVLLGQDALDQANPEEAEERANAALAIDPRLPAALRLKSDIHLVAGRAAEALRAAEAALVVNPHDQQSLARRATAVLLAQGVPPGSDLEKWLASTDAAGSPPAFQQVYAELLKSNSHPGSFLTGLGVLLEQRRRFDAAEVCFRRAIAVAPKMPNAKSVLGMLLMRTGKTAAAKAMLEDALKADPYHMRVSNFRKVLTLLDKYHVITTERFVIRVDPKADKLLGEYMAEYLEEIYPELVAKFGFAPPEKTQFEIFSQGEGGSGHEWFSARMVGLPWIRTIGASNGMMVAMVSPSAANAPMNWARVLRHEFVHVITLQQTKFNIPHWFTEALAVSNEGFPPPREWNKLLADRLDKGELRTLDTLDRGFHRPANSGDWQLAYCQSYHYVAYMTERGGKESLPKMLATYRRNVTTGDAVRQTFGVEPAVFEQGYRDYLARYVAAHRAPQADPPRTFEELRADYEAQPEDAARAGRYAWALIEGGDDRQAVELAEALSKKDAKERWSAMVLARHDAERDKVAEGIARLAPLLDRAHPQRELLLLLVKLHLLREQAREAISLCEVGRQFFPDAPEFLQGQAAACVQLEDKPRLKHALLDLCVALPDDPQPRQKLAQIALDERNAAEAIRYVRLALQVDQSNADTHRQFGVALLLQKNAQRACVELEEADRLKPGDNEIVIPWAAALIAAGKKPEAAAKLSQALEREPSNAAAKKLQGEIEKKR